MTPSVRLLAAFLLLILARLASAQFDQQVGQVQTKPNLKNVYVVQRLGEAIPKEDTLTDQDGQRIRLGALLGSHPLLILPIFYRCSGVCNVELQGLLKALPNIRQKVGHDFDIVVLSIDPQEGPDLAKAKLSSTVAADTSLKGTEAGWHFLTGDLASIRALTDALGFHYAYDADKDLINHPLGLMVVTPQGTISGYLLSANFSSDALAKDIQIAQSSRIAPKATDVFFGCIHIDPLTGKRSVTIQGILQLFAAVTAITIGVGIFLLSRSKAVRT